MPVAHVQYGSLPFGAVFCRSQNPWSDQPSHPLPLGSPPVLDFAVHVSVADVVDVDVVDADVVDAGADVVDAGAYVVGAGAVGSTQ